MLQLLDIKKSFGENNILNGISLKISKGECVILVGENSTGKTTLLSIGAKMVKPDSGVIHSNGKIAFVPQKESLLEELSVKDNLILHYCGNNLSPKDIFAKGSFEELLGLNEYKNHRVKSLSSGRQKRLAIVLALLKSPDFIIMDEPYSSLDIVSVAEVSQIIARLKEEGKGLLISTHNMYGMMCFCDRVLVLKNGVISAEIDTLNTKMTMEEINEKILGQFREEKR